MSTINSKNVQVGTSGTASQNFTLYQPATPDGTVRLGVGNSGATTLDAVTVTSAGNVGIGVSSIPSDMRLYTRSATATGKGFYSDNGVNSGYVVQFANNLTSIGNDFGNPFAFLTGNTERMRIGSNGNVGIGTTTTTDGRLSVFAGTAATGNSLFLQNSDGTINPYLQFQHSTSGVKLFIGNSFSGANNNLMFGSSNINETMRIDGNGSLLLGVTSPIGSSSNTSQGVQLAPNFVWVATSDAMYIQRLVSDGTVMRFLRGATQVGSISVTATTTTYSTSSDYRLKENVLPMTGALAKVAALKPVTYKWKADGSDGEGFIAHELQEVVPNAVTGVKDAVNEDGSINPQGIDTSFLVATLTAAIKEQQAIIESLTARIAALEAK